MRVGQVWCRNMIVSRKFPASFKEPVEMRSRGQRRWCNNMLPRHGRMPEEGEGIFYEVREDGF
ncbi:MAG: hypothetical protein A3F54_01540 [Candidatus Kerfeldbacteria bacterium RIFCSPHIGHO2_12_FULL_48_17]|uniref:Uncharacterized protein n=1 Tax=Candidatus Kerfeldbacteria bacterium RIFCSPHIGHO2_12_FULL_48_17 TaxID=1798542 RepID=A0A1G2B932_9BACT|nr:MAG: hypothetical protein A3F54_01540 [Candidatus Kerfeldbacteria bacterium RIFCSPHIGHO2_12_FULL_48_17]